MQLGRLFRLETCFAQSWGEACVRCQRVALSGGVSFLGRGRT